MTTPTLGVTSIADTLLWRAEHQRDQRAFTFIGDDGVSETTLTYEELYRRASSVAAELRRRRASGERVLLLYSAGEEYVVAIYGCLLAGAVAIPAYPPRRNRLSSRIESIVADAQPKLVLTTSAIIDGMSGLTAVDRLATDRGLLEEVVGVDSVPARDEALAVLQYTSGSTGDPRGVMVTHGNLQHNMRLIAGGFQMSGDDRGLLWLPSYHDMGLIGGVLLPPYVGFPVGLMPPSAFLQRPMRWLDAIGRHRATISGGPNFGYDLCVARTTEEERATLDLASWRVAFVGAEPVRPASIDRFARAFEASGFRRSAFYPCYGLAEATLIVAGGNGPSEPLVKQVSQASLARHRFDEQPENERDARPVVSCGRARPETTIAIVDPDTAIECEPGRVGEIWVSGPSIAGGYWNRPDQTEKVFGSRIRGGDPQLAFMRTGDYGALADGELFVTGRLKDVIIIHGRNHYAEDIEWTAEQSHDALAGMAGAAFSIDVGGEERVVLVHEVKRTMLKALAADAVIGAMRTAVAHAHDLPLHAIVLVKPLSVPKTSSGKTQRRACREAFLAGTLESVASWNAPIASISSPPDLPHLARMGVGAGDIERWLVEHIARTLGIEPAAIDVRQPFAFYGLSSLQAVSLSAALEDWLQCSLPATLAYDYPTIASLARHLAGDEPAASRTSRRHGNDHEPVAIVGMACRFPGAPNVEAFWHLLQHGVDAIGDVPSDRRALWKSLADARKADATFPSQAGFIGRVDEFDAEFFGIAPREAESIDPQQRLLLEIAADALDDAGVPRETIRGTNTGVFVGISSSDYSRIRPDDSARTDPYAGTGNALSIAANRLSYVFDLRGPSLAVDTACSSALVAVHLACESLRTGACDVALAAGVNLLISPAVTASFAEMGFLARDARCKAFDARADGYVRGEGAGVVILKPMSHALADGDRIYAVIRGSAVNNDGRTNGLTAPSRQAQEVVLREAYAAAGVSPARVQYVEAHGTGTSLGDPIELSALGGVLGEGRDASQPCFVGSVKTNIGHLEAAAGIAGLMKAALAVHHAAIPPSLHFESPNPRIPFETLPLRVPRAHTTWPGHGETRIAGVSAFGFGGTNAHIVLQETPRAPVPAGTAEHAHSSGLLALSATSAERLSELTREFAEFLSSTEHRWEDICHTANVRRSHYDHRLALVARSPAEAAAALRAAAVDGGSLAVRVGRAAQSTSERVAFVFTGQGAQWWAMGRELLERHATFRNTMDACETAVRRHGEWSLLDALRADEAHSRLHETAIAQPALVAFEIALAACWREYGVRPSAVVGHSVGEIAAAHVAGALTLDDAMRIAVARGRVMQRAHGLGEMAVVHATLADVESALRDASADVSIAAVNSPTQVVLAGTASAVECALASLRARGMRCHALSGRYAFHSGQMDALVSELADAVGHVPLQEPSIEIVPTAEGWRDESTAFGPAYWPQQMRRSVRFADAVGRLIDSGYTSFVELGPHSVLSGAVAECLRERNVAGIAVPTLRRGSSDRETMLDALGALYCAGVSPAWTALTPSGGAIVPVPRHPWRRKRYWIEQDASNTVARTATSRVAQPGATPAHPLLGRRMAVSVAGTHVWENEIDRRTQPFLGDHRFQGGELVPGTAYFEMAVAAATEVFGSIALELSNIEFRAPMFLSAEGPRATQVVLTRTGESGATFRVFSRPGNVVDDAEWTLHALGNIACASDASDAAAVGEGERDTIRTRCTEELTGQDYFAELAARGFDYGPAFRGLSRLWRRAGESFGRLDVPDAILEDLPSYHLHPALLDAGAQLVVATDGAPTRPFLPAGVDRIHVRPRGAQPMWGHASYRAPMSNGTQGFAGDVRLFDREGNVVVEARGLRVRYVDDGGASEHLSPDRWIYALDWQRGTTAIDSRSDAFHGTWIVFADTAGVGEHVAESIARGGGQAVLVFPGEQFTHVAGHRYRARPGIIDDLRLIASHLRRNPDVARGDGHAGPSGVIHLWTLDAPGTSDLHASALPDADRLGVGTIIATLQAFGLGESPERCAVWIATRGAQQVREDDSCAQVAQAPVWGLGRTLLQEQPALAGGLIDLDPTGPPDVVAAALAHAIAHPDGETQIALRGGTRYVARLVRASAPDAGHVQFRADASYLITGGLGGLGLSVANWMIDGGARRLILLGRTQLPPRGEWTGVPAGSRAAESIAAIRALEARGASVHLASIDVSDEAGLQAFISGFQREGWPSIRGVVHAAGVVQDEVLSRVSPATLEAVSRAKVVGSWLLHRQFAADGLDFFVLFSSAASLLGSAGQGPYASANAFLDALAHYRRSLGLPALSVNWGPWEAVGMAAGANIEQRFARRGIASIAPAQGMAVLGRILHATRAQLGVIPVNWGALAGAVPATRSAPLFERLREEFGTVAEPGATGVRERILAAAPTERAAVAERIVREEVARVARLDAESVDVNRSLDALGIDSLMSIELKNRLERSLGISIPVVRLLEVPTASGLATLLVEEVARASSYVASETVTAYATRSASNGTPVTALRSTGAEPPLFLVHPGALDARCYGDLATRLGDDQPCYVLQPPELENSRGLDGELPLDISIESVAASCIETLRSIQPRGPYRLGGWSLGGVVAFDIAQQLEAQGDIVSLLALFDAPSPASGERPDDWDDRALVRLFASYLGARHGREITLPAFDAAADPEEAFHRLHAHALDTHVLPADVDVEHVRSLYMAYKNGLRMGTTLLWRYRPRPYSGPITYFRAAEESAVLRDVFPAATETWAGLTTTSLELHEVPGSHYTMFLSPHAATLAESLRRRL